MVGSIQESKASLIARMVDIYRARQAIVPKLKPAEKRSEAAEGAALLLHAAPGQRLMWIATQLDPDSRSYHLAFDLRFSGPFDRLAAERAVAVLQQRHEPLRTTFVERDGELLQRIAPPQTAQPCEWIDLESIPLSDRAEAHLRLLTELAKRPFDLETGPLFRPTLLRYSEQEHHLFFALHHIIVDGSSMSVLKDDFTSLYDAFTKGGTPGLGELELQYGDICEAFVNWPPQEVVARDLAYWTKKLSGVPPLLELPADRPRPTHYAHLGHQFMMTLPEALLTGLKALAQSQDVTLFTVLAAALSLVLKRHSGQDDISIGMPVSSRPRGAEKIAGLFLNTVVLRSDLGGDPSFSGLLDRTKETLLEAFAHQDTPFEQVLSEIKPPHSRSHTPLFQVMLTLMKWTEGARQDITSHSPDIQMNASLVDLFVRVVEAPSELSVYLEYNTEIFERSTIERLFGHLRVVLESIVKDAARPISTLSILTPPELTQVDGWNATERAFPHDRCFHELVEAQVQRTPDAVAIEFDERRMTYRELERSAQALACRLQASGVAPGVLVGIFLERSPQIIVSVLAVLKCGAAYVPLDPEYPVERTSFMMADSGASVLITQTSLKDRAPESKARVLYLDATSNEPEPTSFRRVESSPDDLIYVIYTSGSTGRPKGVEMTHRPVVNELWGMREAPGLSSDDVFVALASLSFDPSVFELFLPLMVGARVVIGRREHLLDGEALAALIERSGATCVEATPTTWRILLATGWRGPKVKALCGGEMLSPKLASELLERTAEVWNVYGPTETTIWSTTARILDPEQISVGRPIANMRMFVLDSSGQLAPIGVPGELCIGGIGLARGYWGQPELTAERFVMRTMEDGRQERLYRSGDQARWIGDGNLDVVGRIDHQLKIRGHRIEPGEIEGVISRHPDIRETVVVARDDGRGALQLVAYTAARTKSVPVSVLREYLRSQLPEYMVPSAFVELDRLPLTPNGKVDRKALPAPKVEPTAVRSGKPKAQLDPLEAGVAGCFELVLGQTSIGVHDNFFDCGGHSLLVTRLISQIRRALGREVPLGQLFKTPTVAGISAHLRAQGSPSLSQQPIPLVQRTGPLPLSLTQQPLWLLQELEPDADRAYHIGGASRLEGLLNVDAMERALRELVSRHEALRTRFDLDDDDMPSQIVEDASKWQLALESVEDFEAAQLRAKAALAEPFDVEQGPLFRAWLLKINSEDHVLVLCMHHLVSDGWSKGVLWGELSELYEALSQGLPSPLSPLPLQFADYAAWHRTSLQGAKLERQLSYWTQHLRGAPPALELPTDRARPAQQSYAGACYRWSMPASLERSLAALGRAHDATLFMTLLSAMAIWLGRQSGQSEVVIGAPTANRTRAELEGLIGFFVNTLALRIDLSGDPSFEALLLRVKDVALNGYMHQDAPFDRVVEALKPSRDPSRSPVFQAMLTLQNAGAEEASFSGLQTSEVALGSQGSKFDLALQVVETKAGLRAELEYSTDLFDETTAARMAARFEHLLEQVVADPAMKISDMDLCEPTERQLLLYDWNTTEKVIEARTFDQRFDAQAKRTPDAIALEYRGKTITYGELSARSNQLAHYLRGQGVGPEVLVGVCYERGIQAVMVMLGVLKAGGGYVPLDPSYPRERLDFMVRDSGMELLVTHEEALDSAPDVAIRTIVLDRQRASIEGAPEHRVEHQAKFEHSAYVIFTSGSTGRPKGVLIEHGAFANFIESMSHKPGLTAEDVMLAVASISFDMSMLDVCLPLCVGARVVIAPREDVVDAANLIDLIRSSGVTVMHATASTWQMAVAAGLERSDGLECMTGGETLPEALAEALLKRCRRVWNGWGPTETTIFNTVSVVEPGKRIAIGHPFYNNQIYVLDDNLNPAPIGVAGEAYLGGAQVGRGFLNRPELTKERFLPDPFRPGGRMYKSGDMVRWRPDGELEFVGRRDFQVKLRGYRIELGEVTAALESHANVREAAVIVREDVPGDKRLVGYYAAEGATAPTVSELREHVKQILPSYMVPAHWVELSSLPRTANNKLDRRALPKPQESEAASSPLALPFTF